MAQTEKQYKKGRRSSTEADIEQCFGDKDQLTRLLSSREGLARTYAEDGAVHTARLIETIDIALIQQALRLNGVPA